MLKLDLPEGLPTGCLLIFSREAQFPCFWIANSLWQYTTKTGVETASIGPLDLQTQHFCSASVHASHHQEWAYQRIRHCALRQVFTLVRLPWLHGYFFWNLQNTTTSYFSRTVLYMVCNTCPTCCSVRMTCWWLERTFHMLEQGHIIDPDSQQVGADPVTSLPFGKWQVIVTTVTWKVWNDAKANFVVLWPSLSDVPNLLRSEQVVGMIRPMSGDFEFFDPIPLQAGCSVRRGWQGVACDQWQVGAVTVLFCKFLWHFGKLQVADFMMKRGFRLEAPTAKLTNAPFVWRRSGEGSWAMRVVQQFRQWSQSVNFVENLKEPWGFLKVWDFCYQRNLSVKSPGGIPDNMNPDRSSKRKIATFARSEANLARGTWKRDGWDIDGSMCMKTSVVTGVVTSLRATKVEQEEGNPVSALDVAMSAGLSPWPVHATQSPECHVKAGWYVVHAAVLKYRLEKCYCYHCLPF